MKLDIFLKKIGITEVSGFTHDDIGKTYDIKKALCEFISSKYKIGQQCHYADGDEDDYPDLENYFIADYEEGMDIKECISLEDILTDIWVYAFKHCACGDPGEMLNLVMHVNESLQSHETDALWRKHMYIVYDLDRVEFAEHGSSVYGSWITTLGWAFIVLVKASGFYKPIGD